MEYFISKLSKNENGLIDSVYVYSHHENESKDLGSINRVQLLKLKQKNKISTIHKDSNGKWRRGKEIRYENNLFSWDKNLPINKVKRKTFISYYHADDQYYKEKFKKLFGDLIVNKSVEKNDIDSDNSDEYIKKLIQKDYLADTTVLVVLIGINTRHRMHVDWEISGALNLKVGDKYSGLLGIILPNHSDFGSEDATIDLLPARFADNLKSGYAVIRDWTENRVKMQEYIELAFTNRISKSLKRNNSRIQMKIDTK